MQTELYRHFDADGQLLYVGISWSAVARYCAGHRVKADWARHSVIMTIERFSTRRQALAAEAEAIKAEAPLHNSKPIDAAAYRAFFIGPSVSLEPENRQIGYALADVPNATLDASGVSRDHLFTGLESESRVVRSAREGDTVHAFGVPLSDVAMRDLEREGVAVVLVPDGGYIIDRACEVTGENANDQRVRERMRQRLGRRYGHRGQREEPKA